MFDFVHNNKAVQLTMKLMLGALAIALVGTGTYSFVGDSSNDVAKVGDSTVTRAEVERMMEMRGLGQDQMDLAIESAVQRHQLLQHARELGLHISDDEVRKAISTADVFQSDGRFSHEAYQAYLNDKGMTAPAFESYVREELMIGQLMGQTMRSSFLSKNVSQALGQFVASQREIRSFRIESAPYLNQVKVSDQEVTAYYQAHSKDFQQPEQVRVEYVVLSVPLLAAGQTVTEDEIKAFYEKNKAAFSGEERQSRHILIMAPPNGDAAAKQAAKAQAEKVLQDVRKDPARFAELAKQYSQDPGSAAQGGDLGWKSDKDFVPEFSKALFALQPNQISDVVETQFGYHVIQLTGVKTRGLEEARSTIEERLKQQAAQKLYPTLSEDLGDLAVENEKNLAPVAQKLKLPLQTTSWMSKTGLVGDPLFSNKDVLERVFSADGLAGRTTEVIEISEPQQRLVARVVERKPARLPPLAEVAPGIRAKLQNEAAAKLAAAEGQRLLAALQKGEPVAASWGEAKFIGRRQSGEFSPELVKQAMALPNKDDQYGGVAERGGFTLFKVGKVMTPPPNPDLAAELERAYFTAEMEVYQKVLGREIPARIMRPRTEN